MKAHLIIKNTKDPKIDIEHDIYQSSAKVSLEGHLYKET